MNNCTSRLVICLQSVHSRVLKYISRVELKVDGPRKWTVQNPIPTFSINGSTGPLSSSAIKCIIFNFEWGIILNRSDSPKTKTIFTCSWADKSKSNHQQVTYFNSRTLMTHKL